MDLEFLSAVDEKDALLRETAHFIFDHAETAFTKFASAACLCDALRKEGFTVEENLAGIKTAFSGRFGSGKPVIGILGEFDALCGLGQVAGATEKFRTDSPTGTDADTIFWARDRSALPLPSSAIWKSPAMRARSSISVAPARRTALTRF